jgi:hypothetical protein
MQKPKVVGAVDHSFNSARRRQKIEAEEAEIARLEAQARGEEVEEEEEETETSEVEQVSKAKEVETEEDDETLSPEERSFKKRYGDLRRYMQEKEKEWNEKFESLQKQPNKNVVPPKSDEDIEAWARKYPDVAGIVETIAKKQAQEMFNRADSRLKEFDKINRETEVAKAEAQIRKTHADFDELRRSNEFHDWAEEQPKWVQDALYENADDPASVVRVIDLYKADKGLTSSAKKQNTKAAASDVSSKSRVSIDEDGAGEMVRESQVAKMSDKEFEANYDRILKAQRSGKFVYDISGSAR